jgi:hypothetical protein
MTVKKLIEILTKEVKKADRENAEIEFWHEKQQYDIDSIHGWGLSPDVSIQLKSIETPMIQPMRYKKEHTKMIKAKVKEIKKDLVKK